jgi:sec-independent protein translocase protein TatA
MPNIGVPELVVIMVLALLLFGAGKLPEVGRSLGRAVREFKRAVFSLDLEEPDHREEHGHSVRRRKKKPPPGN